jgi:hypothetical protein
VRCHGPRLSETPYFEHLSRRMAPPRALGRASAGWGTCRSHAKGGGCSCAGCQTPRASRCGGCPHTSAAAGVNSVAGLSAIGVNSLAPICSVPPPPGLGVGLVGGVSVCASWNSSSSSPTDSVAMPAAARSLCASAASASSPFCSSEWVDTCSRAAVRQSTIYHSSSLARPHTHSTLEQRMK